MKDTLHPAVHPVIFRDLGAQKDFFGKSTLTSEEKEKIKGVEYFIIHMEVTSASHPFYTGKQKFLDTSGRVEKFQKRMEQAKAKSQ